MHQFIQFIKSKTFFVNILAALVVLVLIFCFTYRWLDSYTNHGETISVPDMRGLKITELESFLSNKHIKFKVADSTVFDMNKPAGTIIEQDPAPNEKVKENRTVYVTITRTIAPVIKMPDLIDNSFRQAEAILESYGLKLGQISYKPDLAKNAVLEQKSGGKIINAGDEVSKGTRIDLVLGDGYGNTMVSVPQLYNLTLSEALFVLRGSSLNVGLIIADNTVKDSTIARVYKQEPAFIDTATISQGQAIDIYITQSEAILKLHEDHDQ
jgi:beta-lactam-binding protein with PASTA domain